MCIHFQNIKFGVQVPLVEIGLTVWQKMGAGLKHGQQFHISFWFLLLASMARKECSQQHFLNVHLFSKDQIWYPSPLHRNSFWRVFGQIGLTLRIMSAVEISVFRDFITNMEVILDQFKGEKLEIWQFSLLTVVCLCLFTGWNFSFPRTFFFNWELYYNSTTK